MEHGRVRPSGVVLRLFFSCLVLGVLPACLAGCAGKDVGLESQLIPPPPPPPPDFDASGGGGMTEDGARWRRLMDGRMGDICGTAAGANEIHRWMVWDIHDANSLGACPNTGCRDAKCSADVERECAKVTAAQTGGGGNQLWGQVESVEITLAGKVYRVSSRKDPRGSVSNTRLYWQVRDGDAWRRMKTKPDVDFSLPRDFCGELGAMRAKFSHLKNLVPVARVGVWKATPARTPSSGGALHAHGKRSGCDHARCKPACCRNAEHRCTHKGKNHE